MRKAAIFLVLPLLLHAFGCSKEDPAIREAVVQYNNLLAEGYRTLNMSGLLAVATEERATKAYHHMAAIGEARIRMEARLKELAVSSIRQAGNDRATASSKEVWEYSYFHIDSGDLVDENTVTYSLTYHLRKGDGRWLVEDIKVLSAEEKKKSKDLFKRPEADAVRPHTEGDKQE